MTELPNLPSATLIVWPDANNDEYHERRSATASPSDTDEVLLEMSSYDGSEDNLISGVLSGYNAVLLGAQLILSGAAAIDEASADLRRIIELLNNLEGEMS